jgi:hypothetical protein
VSVANVINLSEHTVQYIRPKLRTANTFKIFLSIPLKIITSVADHDPVGSASFRRILNRIFLGVDPDPNLQN